MSEKLSVNAIHNGTVIDHIVAGQATKIIRLLALINNRNQMTIGLNLTSGSQQLKDLIKLEQCQLSEKDLQQIAVFAPGATVNTIQDYKVTNKLKLTLPEQVADIFICPNKNCISHSEKTTKLFYIKEQNRNVGLQCKYCQQIFLRDEMLLTIR